MKNAKTSQQTSLQLDLWGREAAEISESVSKQASEQPTKNPQPVGQVNMPLDEPIVFPDEAERVKERLLALTQSKFRMSWNLKVPQVQYIREKGISTIARHAQELIASRLAPAYIPNDGSQTPMKGHPVFIAQHATGTCCRSCLMKWHHIRPAADFTPAQQHYVTSLIMTWMRKQLIRWQNRVLPKPQPRRQQTGRKKPTSEKNTQITRDFFE